MSLDLPYSIIRGEIVSVPIVVFNYFNEEVTAEVTFKNEGEFEFADASNEVVESPSKQLFKFYIFYFKKCSDLLFWKKVFHYLYKFTKINFQFF